MRFADPSFAAGTSARVGTLTVAVDPFDDTVFVRYGLRFCPAPIAVVHGDADALVEERLPVLCCPDVVICSEQGDDLRFVASYGFQHARRGRPLGIEDQVGA